MKNKEKRKIEARKYYLKNREKIIKKAKIKRQKNIIESRKKQREYYYNHKEKYTKKSIEYQNNRRKNDLNFKLRQNLRKRLRTAIKNKFKSGSAILDLGCSIEKFILWLEMYFQEGMNWNNYGEWHIDHIKPLSKFDLENRDELLKACHFSNLQPLWAKDNLSKGNKECGQH